VEKMITDSKELSPEVILDPYITKQAYHSKIKEIFKYHILNKPLEEVMKNILSFIFINNSAIWFEMDLTEELKDYKAKLPVEFDTTSTSQTIEWLKSQNQNWVVHPKEITAALNYNHCWPSVRSNGKIIGCVKIGTGNIYIVDYNKVIEFPQNMAFIYDTYVLKDQRGKGVAKYLIAQAVKFLKTQGYTKVGCHIPPWNTVSIKIYEKIGFKKVSYIKCFRILRIPIRLANPAKMYPNV
jgi:ribosomal protein S18 acetylase RimI-like enzyme